MYGETRADEASVTVMEGREPGMPTRITQIEGREEQAVVLRVEGELFRRDAEIVERACTDLRERLPASEITLDLADLTFFDSESASVLCRVRSVLQVKLDGLQLSVQRAVALTGKVGPA